MRRALFAIGTYLVAALAAPAMAGPAPMNATPALWTVHGPKGTAYMLGSIHALPKNVNWQTPEIMAAMKRADTFVFELRMDEDNKARIAGMFRDKGMLPFSISLPSLFDEAMRQDYCDVIMQTHADPSAIVYMRPWLAALVLESAASGDSDFVATEGVDNKVYAWARTHDVKNFRAFETDELQMHVLMSMEGAGDEIKALRATMRKILSERPQDIHGMLAAWSKGDVKGLAAFGPDSTELSPENKKALLEDRNRAWIPQIAAMLNEKHTYFITVGAGHLVGKTGVPNLLREKGYKVDGPDAPQTAVLKLSH
jgi:uncharacterized protein